MPDRTPYSLARPTRYLQSLLAHSAAGGVILMITAALAILVANSPLADLYQRTLASYVGGLSVLHWINDGLMAVFFLLVGLEIKREVLEGELSSWPRRILPGSAALGGMIGPALIYLAFNLGPTGHPSGWAIPAATDIAFALGVLSLLGPRVPVSLRVFLMALAIIDDLGAVVIIALFYTTSLDAVALGGAGLVTLALIALNRVGVNRLLPYIALGALLWLLVLLSGIHATLAGVILAFTVPLRTRSTPDAGSPLLTMEHGIQPWVTFLIVPVFGFANAGVSFAGMSLSALMEPVPLGVALGLFVGKQLGVFLTSAAVIALGLATLPAQATWKQMYGLAALCGIGFTMSLFIGLLAFPDSAPLQDQLKLGVLAGSLISTLLAVLLLRSRQPAG
ncbi:Na+/H+ antiporter NhaA [Pigmentiphaga litoralis]|uniref:Na(+)/H(+) antiporter NhaA n=1 Tax=Pigmentiphaga litoralis TaxID=516702 RepID=A0A7Y9LLH8_9BURK|nr:Na+/H+ antiporter NhaA [Pigmentiphaga litoralis]NYE25299.1 NhaA family Na+:H+ antiporter [Pigmentiphaga litoralis]NYE81088.1 NhaA family Na+:H+ antiporter [Pigmentiphaga litoralis]